MRAILIHGYNANPEMNFHPWLANELRNRGWEVIAPQLPLSDEPNPLESIQALEEAVGRLDSKTVIIGHSLGGVLALRYLEAAEAESTPRAVILVGAPWHVNSPKIKSFFMTEFDFDVVMWKAQEFVVVHDEGDKAIPINHAEKYAKVLGADFIKTTGNDHFTGEQYPELLDIILKKSEPLPEMAPGMSLEDDYAEKV